MGYHPLHSSSNGAPLGLSLKERVAELEQEIIIAALKRNKTIRKTARTLKISHPALIKKMRKYNIKTVTQITVGHPAVSHHQKVVEV
jgi:DNA-binding NtrC family response regulator